MINFNKIPNIYYWSQRVLPTIFDESLTYLEKVNKLEENINKLIEEYNKFGEEAKNEINNFETETTEQIDSFVNNVTQQIQQFETDVNRSMNEFESLITSDISKFKLDVEAASEDFVERITEQQNKFEVNINNRINAMQEEVDKIPQTITEECNNIVKPWLETNAQQAITQATKEIISNNAFIYEDLNTEENMSKFSRNLNNVTITGIYKYQLGGLEISYENVPKLPSEAQDYIIIVSNGEDPETKANIIYQWLISQAGTLQRYAAENDELEYEWSEWSDSLIYSQSADIDNFIPGLKISYCKLPANKISFITTDTWCICLSAITTKTGVGNSQQLVIPLEGNYKYSSFYRNLACYNFNNTKTWTSPNGWVQNNTAITSFKTTGVYNLNLITTNSELCIHSESGGSMTPIPNNLLQYGSVYAKTVINNQANSVDENNEKMQYIYNTGSEGARIYEREQNGNNWTSWKPIVPKTIIGTFLAQTVKTNIVTIVSFDITSELSPLNITEGGENIFVTAYLTPTVTGGVVPPTLVSCSLYFSSSTTRLNMQIYGNLVGETSDYEANIIYKIEDWR